MKYHFQPFNASGIGGGGKLNAASNWTPSPVAGRPPTPAPASPAPGIPADIGVILGPIVMLICLVYP